MRGSRPFAIDFVSGLIRFGGDDSPAGSPAHPLARALGPALDTAFGLEHEALFPEEIRLLVEALHAGPLGMRASAAEALLELA
ncbi:hypothetical protein GCM10007884_13970 [Methylobacterium brachythecii]|nr:hypothetical protein GCM10007884_13970 [Methylobacterium brachythecii]